MTVTSAPTKPLRWRVWRGTTWQNILDNSIRVKSATMSAQRQTTWNCTMLPNTKALDTRVISVVIKQPRLAGWTGTKNWSTGTNEEVTRSQICTTPTMRKYSPLKYYQSVFLSFSDMMGKFCQLCWAVLSPCVRNHNSRSNVVATNTQHVNDHKNPGQSTQSYIYRTGGPPPKGQQQRQQTTTVQNTNDPPR